MRSERGSVTIWVLGLSLLLLVFGGLALDYWRALATQRELASVADSAAIAGASGIDEAVYRNTGQVVLNVGRARGLVFDAVRWQDVEVVAADIVVDPEVVTVTLAAQVDLGLLGVLVADDTPLLVRGTASATPVLVP
ncbi:MAG TPA: pilus assembly protein TadG-related protein [Acidimicrobiia bacterium]|nr:pilus assembly protein TadG-related protein [Acidimicrobiia bacterium]